jgi:hypothetical protein
MCKLYINFYSHLLKTARSNTIDVLLHILHVYVVQVIRWKVIIGN